MQHPGNKTITRKELGSLTLGALGVVFGDVGTSPLYTLRECLTSINGMPLSEPNVFGILSLIFWSLAIVISLKYALFIMRLDNRGEGGILALLALTINSPRNSTHRRALFVLLGIFGAALFFGDGMITPAISVLSAVEGLKIAEPTLQPWVIPLTILILIALFIFQQVGTTKVGVLFGPLIGLWFLTIGGLGLISIMRTPTILAALNPLYAADFFMAHGIESFVTLGAVVLAVTGAEALYADMGHFGRKPIHLAWFWFVLPALILNYFGQGALILRNPAAIANPFYKLAPHGGLYVLILIAAIATIIASQAVISGAFSLSRQAIQLGFLPRMDIRHTSAKAIGQIYVPFINWSLLAAIITLVIGFKSSDNLASAYGIAVTGTMICTTLLALAVARIRWKWGWPATIFTGALFLSVDTAFFGANTLKIVDGGWFPLATGFIVFTLMTTWRRGRAILLDKLNRDAMPLDVFMSSLAISESLTRVPGTAVFLTGNQEVVPQALLHNLKHNKILHERNVFITTLSRDIPHIDPEERAEISNLGHEFYRIHAWYGFQESPDIPELLDSCRAMGLNFNMMETSFFLSREILIPTKRQKSMALWRERIFISMMRNAVSAAKFFNLPMNRVIELGAQIEI
ncbi:MAG: potassium transporter Kup [Pseudomonadota bacterium]|nr:potassium transporter Kup [Pseudomonadota bacterium]